MSDEQQRPADGGREPGSDPSGPAENEPDGGPRSGDAWVFDRTEQMPRADGTQPMPRAGQEPPAPADGTQPMPRVGADGDETVLSPRPDATSVMPAVGADPGRAEAAARAAAGRNDADEGAANPAWSGRAEVRPPRPGQGGDYTGDWDGVPPSAEPRGKWWLPIVIGIVVLVLLALLGWGLWLIVQSSDKDDDTPAPAATTTAAPAPTTEPTTTAPTTQATTTTATTEPTGPQEVTIPALKGLSSAEARRALDRSGLAYRLRFVTTNDAPAGTVIDSDPTEGQQVPSDTTVTLIIASAPSTKPPTTTTPATTAPTDTTGN